MLRLWFIGELTSKYPAVAIAARITAHGWSWRRFCSLIHHSLSVRFHRVSLASDDCAHAFQMTLLCSDYKGVGDRLDDESVR